MESSTKAEYTEAVNAGSLPVGVCSRKLCLYVHLEASKRTIKAALGATALNWKWSYFPQKQNQCMSNSRPYRVFQCCIRTKHKAASNMITLPW